MAVNKINLPDKLKHADIKPFYKIQSKNGKWKRTIGL